MSRAPDLRLVSGGRAQAERPWPNPLSFGPGEVLAWSTLGAAFASRRAHAAADYWTALAQARGPAEALAVQARFWTRLVDDYARATAQILVPPGPARGCGGAASPVAAPEG